jgi:hypothetical protein
MIYHTEHKNDQQLFILTKLNYDGIEFALSIVKMVRYMRT